MCETTTSTQFLSCQQYCKLRGLVCTQGFEGTCDNKGSEHGCQIVSSEQLCRCERPQLDYTIIPAAVSGGFNRAGTCQDEDAQQPRHFEKTGISEFLCEVECTNMDNCYAFEWTAATSVCKLFYMFGNHSETVTATTYQGGWVLRNPAKHKAVVTTQDTGSGRTVICIVLPPLSRNFTKVGSSACSNQEAITSSEHVDQLVTQESCEAKCSAQPDCKSVQYRDGKCLLQSGSCILGTEPGWNVYTQSSSYVCAMTDIEAGCVSSSSYDGCGGAASSEAECKSLCDAEPLCKAFVYNKYQTCWLKDGTRPAVEQPIHETVSCVKTLTNAVPYPSATSSFQIAHPRSRCTDGGVGSENGGSLARCFDMCDATKFCEFAQYTNAEDSTLGARCSLHQTCTTAVADSTSNVYSRHNEVKSIAIRVSHAQPGSHPEWHKTCAVAAWTPWGVCSKTCGKGVSSRIRTIKDSPSRMCAAAWKDVCPHLSEVMTSWGVWFITLTVLCWYRIVNVIAKHARYHARCRSGSHGPSAGREKSLLLGECVVGPNYLSDLCLLLQWWWSKGEISSDFAACQERR